MYQANKRGHKQVFHQAKPRYILKGTPGGRLVFCHCCVVLLCSVLLVVCILFGHWSTPVTHTILTPGRNNSHVPSSSTFHRSHAAPSRFDGALQGELEWWVHVQYVHITEVLLLLVGGQYAFLVVRHHQQSDFLSRSIGTESNIALTLINMTTQLLAAEISNLVDADQLLLFLLLNALSLFLALSNVYCMWGVARSTKPRPGFCQPDIEAVSIQMSTPTKSVDNGQAMQLKNNTRPVKWLGLFNMRQMDVPMNSRFAANARRMAWASAGLAWIPWMWIGVHYIRGVLGGQWPNNLTWVLPPMLMMSIMPPVLFQPGIWFFGARSKATVYHVGATFLLVHLVSVVSITVLTDIFI